MAIECDLTVNFSQSGTAGSHLAGGWALPEETFTWSIGAESRLRLPTPLPADEFVLTLDVIPFVHPPELPGQRLIVSVNHAVVGSAELSRPTLLGYRIPSALLAGADQVTITLQHPDAVRPRDFSGSEDNRELAIAYLEAKLHRVVHSPGSHQLRLPPGLMLASVRDRGLGASGQMDVAEWATVRTGLTIPQLAVRFESLGENCEFGLFQRRCDAEPLGLLRFSSIFMRSLVRGIENGFEGIGETEDIEPRLEGAPRKEFMIHEKRFGLVYHTFVYEGQRSIWLMREQESARLKFLRRKFAEELHLAEKIFVYKYSDAVFDEEILPLHLALNRYGENTLLWVVPAERDRPPGTVEVIMPGLLKGYIDRFAPDDNAHDLSFEGWLRVCTNACILADLQRSNRTLTERDDDPE